MAFHTCPRLCLPTVLPSRSPGARPLAALSKQIPVQCEAHACVLSRGGSPFNRKASRHHYTLWVCFLSPPAERELARCPAGQPRAGGEASGWVCAQTDRLLHSVVRRAQPDRTLRNAICFLSLLPCLCQISPCPDLGSVCTALFGRWRDCAGYGVGWGGVGECVNGCFLSVFLLLSLPGLLTIC